MSAKSRLCLAPDDHSGSEGAQRNRTASLPRLVTGIDARPVPQAVAPDSYGRPTTHSNEGADMAKRTRGPDLVDSRPSVSGEMITPPTHAGPVTTTSTTA